jgi:hypothetical protein
MDSLVLGGDVPSWHEDEQPLDSPVFSREVSPAAEWRRLAWPSSRGVTPERLLLLTYYTPQVADPDFDYIPLHEKRPAVSEHDRNHAEADDWKSITSCEDLDLDVYTKVTARDGTTIYRKPPYQTDLGDEVGTIGSPTSVNIDGFRVCCNSGGGPPPLAEVHLVTEVSPDNKPHPRSWLGCLRRVCTKMHRVPRHSLYGSNGRARRVSPRASISSTHTFLSCSARCTAHEGQYDGLGIVIGILNHLENREIVQNKRDFVRDFGTPRVTHVTCDDFLRTIRLKDMLDPPQRINDAGIRSQYVIHQELVAAGAENINLQFGTFRGTDDRTRCDRCLVAHTIATGITASDRVKTNCSVTACDTDCELALGTNRCVHCQQIGIDCTYTNDVLEKPALLRALWLAPLTGTETFSIVDLKLVNKADGYLVTG